MRLAVVVVLLAAAGCTAPPDADLDPAHLLVSGVPLPGLLIEVDHVGGRPPSPDALDHLVASLKAATTKREIRILGPTQESYGGGNPAGRKWASDDPRRLHAATFDSGEPGQYAAGEWAVIHVIYAGGHYAVGGREIAGLSFDNVAVLFDSGLAGPLDDDLQGLRERVVLLHEVGHCLGLVDSGAPMLTPRLSEDGEHSTRPESVMWEGGDLVETYRDPTAPRSDRFDEADLRDLAELARLAREAYSG